MTSDSAGSVATSASAWPGASGVVLPFGAPTLLSGNPAVACTGDGACIAVAAYANRDGHTVLIVFNQKHGRWGPGRVLAPPAGASRTSSEELSGLGSVTCTGPGNCVVAGRYVDAKNVAEPLVVTETRGVWGRAVVVKLPAIADARPGGSPTGLSSVTCPTRGNCEAVVDYFEAGGPKALTVATATAGVWGRVSRITPPAGASFAFLNSLACTGPGDCVAVGNADDRPILISQTRGVWGQSRAVAPPPGVHFTTSEGVGHLYYVECVNAGSCVAVGFYATTNGRAPMVISEFHGIWDRAQSLTAPANAASAQSGELASDPPILMSVNCTSPGNCVAVGTYGDIAIDHGLDSQPMVVTETSGEWHRGLQIKLPPGADPALPAQTAWLTSVACHGPEDCVAIGFYDGAQQTVHAMTDSSRPTQ